MAHTLARETGVHTAVLNPLEGLTRDELDAGADYLSVMRDNLAALYRGVLSHHPQPFSAVGCPGVTPHGRGENEWAVSPRR